MEFSFNINELLSDPITVVDDKLAPFRSRVKTDRYEFANKQAQLKTVIDKMGDASTRAQGLRAPITSAVKLQHSDHRLYIMKDPSAISALGAILGILKVGHKKLFLLDMQSVQYEVNPLCVLDFYIHESRQRTGCGKKLFEHMLKMEGKMAHQLAIDRPSHKFVSFLKKHYGLKNAVPQANNFVIHEHFFSDLEAVGHVPRRSQRLANVGQSGRPPVHPYRRTNHDDEPPLLQRSRSGSSRNLSTRPNSSSKLHHFSNDIARKTEAEPSTALRIGDSLRDIHLPPVVPRPSSRNSAPGSRGSSAGRGSVTRGTELGPYEATNHNRSGALNASRGLAARATSYSRYSSRMRSADIAKSNKEGAVAVIALDSKADNSSFYRNNSGGRARSLHLTSVENPFVEQVVTVPIAAREQQEQVSSTVASQAVKVEHDHNSNISNSQGTEPPSGLTSTGNFSVSTLFNNHYAVRPPFMGSSWNIFGVPTYLNKDPSSANYLYTRRTQKRHHPF